MQYIDWLVVVLVMLPRQDPTVHIVQKTDVVVPEIRSIDKVVDVPVEMQPQVRTIQIVRKTEDVPPVQLIGKAIDVPV